MAIRLKANDCTILVVNSAKFLVQFATTDFAEWLPQQAKKLCLPIHDVNFNSHSKEEIQNILNVLSELNTQDKRRKVLVAGNELEESVSLCSLEALDLPGKSRGTFCRLRAAHGVNNFFELRVFSSGSTT
jgi:hypothetical protein